MHEQALANGAFEVELVDLKEVALPLMDEPHHPRLRRYTQQHTRDWSARVDAADAYVFVTPEYNHGLSAPLKNAIDYLHAEWLYKPVGFVSYGGVAGGTRATQMLRQVVLALKMIPVYDAVVIPRVSERLPETAGRFEGDDFLTESVVRMLGELSRLGEATQSLRAAVART